MSRLQEVAREFLRQRRIAVVGVSRDSAQPANLIYRTLRDRGYEVFAVNPAAEEVEGDRCFARVADLPEDVEGAIVVTPPAATTAVVSECAARRIPRVWMHRSFGQGSVSSEAVELCRKHGIEVIPGACPMMFVEGADAGHRCMRWFLGLLGRLPSA